MLNSSYLFHLTVSTLTLLSIFSYFLLYGLDVWVANLLGPILYGNVKIKIRIIHNLVHFLLLGQDGIILIYLRRYQDNKNKLVSFIQWIHKTVLLRSLLVCCLCLCFLMAYFYTKNQFYLDWSWWLVFAPFILILALLDRFFLYLRMYHASFLPRNIIHPLMYAIFLWVFAVVNPDAVLFGYGLTLMLLCVQRLYAYRKHIVAFYADTESFYDKEWVIQSWHYFTSVIILQTSRSLNLYLLDVFGYDSREVGYFAAILTIIFSLYTLTKSVEQYLKPWVTEYGVDNHQLINILKKCNRVRFVQVAVLWCLVWVFADKILLQFGSGYVQYVYALRVLMSCYSIYTLGQANFDLLNFSGNAYDTSRIMIAKLCVMLIMAMYLIPRYGLWGCVLSDGITNVLALVCATYYCKRRLNFHGWLL